MLIQKTNIVPIVLSVILVLIKYSDLSLAYYWDEAWSYMPAVFAMVESGPTLLPSAVNVELFRGHPLLFYFLQSIWMSLYGAQDLYMSKVFPLLISITFIWSFHGFGRRHFNRFTAYVATVFVVAQGVFLAQATLVLPEILLALFTVLSLDSFLSRKRGLTALWLCCALFTKETAVVLFIAVLLGEIIRLRETNHPRNAAYLLVPVLAISSFFALQKIASGWVFFPEHISLIDWSNFLPSLEARAGGLLFGAGRNLLGLVGLASVLILLVKKKFAEKECETYRLMGLFLLGYLVFSAFNFYSPRYLLSAIPFFILLSVYAIESVLEKKRIIAIAVVAIALLNNVYYTLYNTGNNDHTLGYSDAVLCAQEAIAHCEKEGVMNQGMAAPFLLATYMNDDRLGYLSKGAAVKSVSTSIEAETKYVLFPQSEEGEIWINAAERARLLETFERGKERIYLYALP